ncbi:50S ribosomal protein L24 [Candidatus Gracilibacteria bacterium]|nr:50S ribosomal protein L24 [Candidatus Gracilibacteria bacterium]
MKIRKGDNVKVVAGSSKGKEAKVLRVFTKKNTVLLEGVNLKTKYKKKTNGKKGSMVRKEFPIDVSNVMLISPKSGEVTRIGFKKDKSGKKVRVSVKDGEVLNS